jgi:hypothetical protein
MPLYEFIREEKKWDRRRQFDLSFAAGGFCETLHLPKAPRSPVVIGCHGS